MKFIFMPLWTNKTNKAKQKTKQNKTKQNKTKQNKKQNKTKQNKKQNKTKQNTKQKTKQKLFYTHKLNYILINKHAMFLLFGILLFSYYFE